MIKTAGRISAKVGAQFIDPDEYIRINGVWQRKDPDQVEQLFAGGIQATTNQTNTVNALQSLGADLARVYFDINTPATSIDTTINAYAAINCKVLLCATFNGRMPTLGEAQNLSTWANRFGFGGAFWVGRTDDELAITDIEFGHETSYTYQYPADGAAGTTGYNTRAQNYALRFKQARDAIAFTTRPVGLICQAEDGGSGNSAWVDNMFLTIPELASVVSGWSVHPFGPTWEAKIDRLIAHTSARGASTTIPIDITAFGIATDNGAALSDNLGWPVNLTYAEAASSLQATINSMQSKAALGSRLRHFVIREAHDLTAPGANNNRENYWGALTNTLAEKDEFSTVIRSFFGGTPPPPPPPPPPTTKPIVVPSVGSTPAVLRLGSSSGARLQFKGVNVWGLRDYITTTHGANQYANRATVASTIRSWNANIVRFRVLADDYNKAPHANTGQLTKPQIIQQIKDWRDACTSRGLYFMPCTWDALDGDFDDADWPGNQWRIHQMLSDIYAALGNDPMVVYEITNEPNSLPGTTAQQWDAWQANMQTTISHFRDVIGYKGLLVVDPIWWGNSGVGGQGYDDTRYTALENYDASRSGMNGVHQLAFSKHDYAQHYASQTFSSSAWQTGAGGSQIKHLIFETEFGNYNGSPSTVNDSWSQNACVFFRDRFPSQQNYVGACAFLFGPWFDANAMTTADNQTTTTWGTSVKNLFLGTGSIVTPPPPPPPPGALWKPGTVGGADWVKGSQSSQQLGAKLTRGHDITPGTAATALDSLLLNYFNRGIQVILLANWGANPTPAEANNLGTWAARFGPGGAFWAAHPNLNANLLAVRYIEFGNEHSFNYRQSQLGNGTAGSPGYNAYAQVYAQRALTAAQAIRAANQNVSLLVQAEDGGSGNPAWVNNMYIAVPNLHAWVGGWVVHPYGTGGFDKVIRMINQTAARGAPATVPIDVTEAGIASDNGRTLNDNYGWPTNLTYAAAATTYQNYLNQHRNDSRIQPRLRHWCYYQSFDQRASGTTNEREHYFGALQNNLSEKGAFTTTIRSILAST